VECPNTYRDAAVINDLLVIMGYLDPSALRRKMAAKSARIYANQ
jgi:hypothetical protein